MELKTYFAQDAAGNIISSAIVNVFLQGTTTLATGLTRADGSPLENPFAADGAGRIQFRAPDGYYDVQVSAGPGIIQTLTIQCVDYSGAKADADRAESAADRAESSAEDSYQQTAIFKGPDNHGLDNFYGGGGWSGENASTENIYNTADDTNNNALRWRYDVPSTDNQLPIAYLKKTITTTRDPLAGGKPGRWDEGTIYSHVKKLGGSAYSAGITSMFDAVGGTGDSVSIHARANGRKPHVVGGEEGSGVWGLWSFAVATPSDGTWIKQMLGLEIDCINNGQAIPFPLPTGQGAYIGAQITAVNGICSHGLEIGAGSGASWHRGIFIRQGSITPSNAFPNTSAIEIEGGTFNNRMGGLKFGKGYFDYGINLAKPSEDYSNNAAIVLGDGNRIVLGDSPASTNWIGKVAAEPSFNFQNLTIKMNGTQVLTTRRTGWGAVAGTATRTGFDTTTVTTTQLAERVKALIDDLKTHGIIGA